MTTETQQHTPGNWRIYYTKSGAIGVGVFNGRVIANVPHHYHGAMHDDTLADAALIAAAPDLLAAAQFTLKCILQGISLEHPDFHVAEIRLQDAIAKAASLLGSGQKGERP